MGSHDSLYFHHVDETRGARIADAQAALYHRDGCLAGFGDDADGVVEEVVRLVREVLDGISPFSEVFNFDPILRGGLGFLGIR